jgi:hypothetical protein
VTRALAALCALLGLAALALPASAAAHGIGGIRDLPVPGWLFLVGGATVLVISFVALGALWNKPKLEVGAGRPLPEGLQRVLLSPYLRVVVSGLSLALFIVIWTAAAFGSERGSDNLAPTFIYITFWVGVLVLQIVLGNVWSVLDPWRAAADAVAWAARQLGWSREPRPYPAWLGLWPAVVLLFSFIALELVYSDAGDPRTLAWAITAYSIATWTGMAIFGRRDWRENGDGFAVYFGFISRAAVFGSREREDGGKELILRKPLSELARVERRPGAVAFLAVMLGSVAFDGISRSSWWFERVYDLEVKFSDPTSAERAVMLFNLASLILVVLFVAIVYTISVRVAEGVVGERAAFSGVFVGSLIPIAIVYALSHYLSYLVVTKQFVIPLLSDPYGLDWNVLGSAGFQPNLTLLKPNTTWYTQVTVLVIGHVLALTVAHDRAVALSPSPRIALRTQYVMLALMVLYTVGGMWLLSLN